MLSCRPAKYKYLATFRTLLGIIGDSALWLMLFNREPVADAAKLKHTTLAIARLRFLFIAAKIWSHAGRTGIHYSDQYQEQGLFQRLMTRLRSIKLQDLAFRPVLHPALK